MGVSASSLLDESQSAFIRGQAEAELAKFSPFYRKQFSVARFLQAQEDLEPQQEKTTQLLRQRPTPEEGQVLYEEAVLYFDDTRKWRERYAVVRANYCLECHDSLESFLKGSAPRHKLLPTGGAVLTTEEKYMALVDKCFPDDCSVKEDFAPPLASMPGQFPVYLRLPYRRDSYFCFRQQLKQEAFISILSDCIRHQNQDFLKKTTCEVKAFLKAVQFYRENNGHFESWDMLIGSDVRVLSNAVMEQLLPSLEKDILPKLKAKKTEKKRVWFATVEAAYVLVQQCLLQGLTELKDDCGTSLRRQEVLIHSDMDQILRSRAELEGRVRAAVSGPAQCLLRDRVQPVLGSVLEELMGPISTGFSDGRLLSEGIMDQICQDVLQGSDPESLKKALSVLSRPNLLSCFQKMASLQDKLQLLQERFGFSNVSGVVHSAQIDLQQLMENAAFTFETLLNKALQDNPENAASAVDKSKHRVLKQFDYDSSSVRKRICGDALVHITLPFIKRQLQETGDKLQDAADHVFLDHCNFIEVENVYEEVLLSLLQNEVSKVLKEAASLKKYNLLNDSRDLLSRSSLSSTSGSAPGSPALSPASSPCTANHSPSQLTDQRTTDKIQEVPGGETDPADAQTVESNESSENKMAANIAIADQETAQTEHQEAKVVVEKTGVILEEKEKEIEVKTEQTVETKMPENNENKTEDVTENQEAFSAENEVTVEDKMADVGDNIQEEIVKNDKVVRAKTEVTVENKMVANDGAKMAETDKTQEVVLDVKEENNELKMEAKVETKMADNVEKNPEETVQKEAVVLDTNEETVKAKMVDESEQKLEETVQNRAVVVKSDEMVEEKIAEDGEKKTEEEAVEKEVAVLEKNEGIVEEKMSENDEEITKNKMAAEVQSVNTEGAGNAQTENQEVASELAAPPGGETHVTAAGQTVSESNKSEFLNKEEEDSSEEGSTTSDVLEETSQSPVSSEDETSQSEERSGQTQEDSEACETKGKTDKEQEVEECKQEVEQRKEEERPLDCIRAIRELVEEVIEVEELVQRYPSGLAVDQDLDQDQNPDQDLDQDQNQNQES